jgi:NAD(P)-dependent dehydrogenase (short-subunit alcohol dehydrogenase family)
VIAGSSNPVVVVLSDGRELGRRIAARFAQAGASVTLATPGDPVAIEPADRDDPHDLLRSRPYDPSDPGVAQALVDEVVLALGSVDVWVTIAPLVGPVPAESIEAAEWDAAWSSVVSKTFGAAQAAARVMLPCGAGVIVNVVSTEAFYPVGGRAARSIAEAGVVMLTEALGIEWAGRGVRVVGVATGDIVDEPAQADGADGSARDGPPTATHRVPLRRGVTLDDVADAVAFVAGPDASYIVAETLRVDAGWTAHQLF